MKMDSRFEDDMELEQAVNPVKPRSKKCKVMTMEDVAEQLAGDFEEEIEDSKKYLHMAGIAEKAGDDEDYHYLMEMAKDEYTHAYFIHCFMKDHDMCVEEEHEREFMCLKEKMKDLFR